MTVLLNVKLTMIQVMLLPVQHSTLDMQVMQYLQERKATAEVDVVKLLKSDLTK